MSEKCLFHPLKPSPRCRKCAGLGLQEVRHVETLELKKPEKKHGLLSVHGDKNTWNISSLMRKNVFSSSYFNNDLFQLRDLAEVLQEIERHVCSIEPWIPGTCNTPSSLFCILIKLFILKLTEGQIRFMTAHSNIFVRVTAFLYLRFLCDPQELWERLSSFAIDNLPITPTLTISDFIEKILTQQDYFGLQLPRIPAPIQSLINGRCAQLPFRKERWEKNLHKSFVKHQELVVYLATPVVGVFKHREGNKVHVQVEGKDLHVDIGDIDEGYTCDVAVKKIESNALTGDKKEYMKKAVSYKNALMFQMPSKRDRSPSPEVKISEASAPKRDLIALSEPVKKQKDSSSVEYLRLG